MRVIAALSGGVDSAVAAARAVDAGHEVVGVHLALSYEPVPGSAGSATGAGSAGSATSAAGKGCCTLNDRHDAARTADILGIPFYVWDFAAEFQAEVVDNFTAEYSAGRTPNPCIRCNERIKFAAVLDRAIQLGFDAVCTGHYARLIERPDGGRELHRAIDPAKDQSYVLAVMRPEQLQRSIFPLGDSLKTQVRMEAAARGLLVAAKPDSHDICFIPDGDTAGWLSRRIDPRPGSIMDAQTGESLGTHSGAVTLTIGQRRGLRLSRPASDGQPRYVVATEPATGTVFVGTAGMLAVDQITVTDPIWCGPRPAESFECDIQLRAHGETVPAGVTLGAAAALPADGGAAVPADGGAAVLPADNAAALRVRLGSSVRGVAPGQTLVMYAGTRVIGSATIAAG